MVPTNNPVEQLSSARQPGGRTVWLRWVLAHVLILSPTLSLALWRGTTTLKSVNDVYIIVILLPLVVIAPFVAQWIGIRGVLQTRREFILWLVASVIGFPLAALSLFGVPFLFGMSTSSLSPVGVAACGGVLGLAQWAVLQRHVSRAFWWIPANALGLVAGYFIGWFVAQSVSPICQSTIPCDLLAWVLAIVAGTAVFSVVTGTTLVWLLSQKSEVRPIVSGRSLAVAAGILCLGGVLFALFSFLQIQTNLHSSRTRLYGVSMVSTEEAWAVGESDRAVIFHYGGGKWTETSLTDSLKAETLRDISMASANEGWAVGDRGTFLHYTNGAWSKADTPAGIGPGLYIRRVEMLSPSEGWALAGDYTLLHYLGGTWAVVDSPRAGTLSDMDFDSAEDGWAVGTGGTFLHYTNGIWQQSARPTSSVNLSGVSMVSQNEGWAVGAYGNEAAILHYAGGKWSEVASPADSDLLSISMVSANEGWAVGGHIEYADAAVNGVVAHYKDGKWVQEELPGIATFPILYRVSMASSDEGWAVGYASALLHFKGGTWTKIP
jgi:photosystem II stability/assembly factor-like uncharacterized protein